MRTLRVVVRDELSEDQPEVLLVKDDQVVKANLATTSFTHVCTCLCQKGAVGPASHGWG